MQKRCRAFLIGALALLSCAAPASAEDPYGHAIISFEWIEDSPQARGPNERALRVAIRPVVPVRSAILDARGTRGITVNPPAPTEGAPPLEIRTSPEGDPRIVLGDLNLRQAKVLEFVVEARPDKAGLAVFTVSGRLASGETFEEKSSCTVGSSTAAVLRHGAAEFPARIVPEDPR